MLIPDLNCVNAAEVPRVPKASFSIVGGQSATWDYASIA
jgi:hypothetical protein